MLGISKDGIAKISFAAVACFAAGALAVVISLSLSRIVLLKDNPTHNMVVIALTWLLHCARYAHPNPLRSDRIILNDLISSQQNQRKFSIFVEFVRRILSRRTIGQFDPNGSFSKFAEIISLQLRQRQLW
jgi:hypothetical protein